MACTGIELISKQGNPYWARTQDFEQHFEYSGVKVPKGFQFTGAYTPFYSECNVMGIVWAKDVHEAPVFLDGINEFGICGGTFYFDHFYKYVPTAAIKASGKVAIRGEELCTWILTHYKTLDEIIENLDHDIGITDEPGPMMGMSVPQHCVMHDETGRAIVIEPSVENGFKFYENPVGVFTNAPTFDWHLNNLKMWLERTTGRTYSYNLSEAIEQIGMDEHTSGLVGLSADYKPESRFMRAAISKLLSIEVDDNQALNQIYQLLTTVNTPKGSLRVNTDDGMKVAWTQYTAGYDIKRKILYAFTYDNRNLRSLEYGDETQWESDIRYFSFISEQTSEPFDEKDVWKSGENTL